MSSSDDFFAGLKSDKDRAKEWADAAQFFVDIRRTPEQPAEDLLGSGVEKVSADFRNIGRMALKGLSRLEPTGVANAMSTKPGAIAGLTGAALFGGGMALTSRGRKELGGESKLEHRLMQSKQLRDARPEPKSMMGKLTGHAADLSASLASTARKHPIQAGLVAALGGAKAGTKLLGAFSRKAVK